MPDQPHLPDLRPPTKLSLILHALLDEARQTGNDHRVRLSGGAVAIARVRGGVVTFAVRRQGVEVGAVELRTFARDAGVPPDAERIPQEGQGERDGWRYVCFRWSDTDVL
jgi:hypothetical protein